MADIQRYMAAVDQEPTLKLAESKCGAAVMYEDHVAILADADLDAEFWKEQADKLRAETERLTVAFAHTHIRIQGSDDMDTCAECLLDIRETVHSTVMIEKRREWRAFRLTPDEAEAESS